MTEGERLLLAQEAGAAFMKAESADDMRRIWRRFYMRLGHRVLGRLLLGRTPDNAVGVGSGKVGVGKPMDGAEIENEAGSFALWPRAFTDEELCKFADSDVNCEALRRTLLADSRFIWLASETSDEGYFVPKRTLLRWFGHVNQRLAQAGQTRLNQHGLGLAISSLRLDGRWDMPPPEAIEFGRRFAFCGSAWTTGQYIFPLAKILEHVSAGSAKRALAILEDLISAQDINPNVVLLEAVEKGLSSLTRRQAHVLRAREGLDGRRRTLQEISTPLRLTRERVRQIEEEAWKRIHHPARKITFVVALLRYVFFRQGSLMVNTNSPDINVLSLVCQAAGVPHAEVPHTGLTILGASAQHVEGLESLWSFPDVMDAEALASRIDRERGLSLLDTDLLVVSERIAHDRRKRLNKAQKVSLALCEVGGPSHYSAVAEAYNRLFPNDSLTERNVHAILGREQYGVVWIGMRGTFALKEWGWEHPSKGLFEAVTEIVKEKYQATDGPVPFTTIAAEIGKLRRAVKASSLTIAAHCNPDLRRIGKDSFLPRMPGDDDLEEIAADELDRILREFESAHDHD